MKTPLLLHVQLSRIAMGVGGLFCASAVSAERPMTIVSVGDSVASGEGNPDVPSVVQVNPNFDPIEYLPNPNFDPLPSIPNPDFDPIPGSINPIYNPIPSIINPNYQPFPIPAILAPLLPDFPAYDPNLTIPNPNYSPTLLLENPDFNLVPLIANPGQDLSLFTELPNPSYDPTPVIVGGAEWTDESAHRSNLAGPALAAADLIDMHPEREIQFIHLAKSGASIEKDEGDSGIGDQIGKALRLAGGRIDVLMISAGGNNVGNKGFGALFSSAFESVKTGIFPSQDGAFNQEIAESFLLMPDLFADLAARIDDCEIGEVFITEYFDPTRDADGEFCLEHGNSEMQWAYETIVVPLNAAIEAAAAQHGWHYVGGIAEGFRNHGYCAASINDSRTVVPNPDFDPRPVTLNLSYNSFMNLPNLDFNPVINIPNFNYNPIANKPNLNYNPVANIPNPNFKLLPPNQDLRVTIPNPSYDPRLTVPNPAYDGRLTVPNPEYDARLTVPNPDYDPNLSIPNPAYDPALVIPNPAFELGVAEGENWVVRAEESLLIQGGNDVEFDKAIAGTAHPNRQGQRFYGDRLVDEIVAIGLENIFLCPEITLFEIDGSMLHFQITSEHPPGSLEIRSTADLGNPDWEDESADIIDGGNELMEAWIERGSSLRRFYRVEVSD